MDNDNDLNMGIDLQEAEVLEPAQNEESEQNEENIEEEIVKKTDNEIIDNYLRPNSRCILCTTPIWAVKLNKSFLDGESYSKIIEKYSSKFEERTGRSLNKSLLHRHFNSHFDVRAAAIAEYNKQRLAAIDLEPSTIQKDIFKLAKQRYIDELEMFDTTAKELITKYGELEEMIQEKKNNGKSFGIDELIIKQAQILNVLNKQSISKFKALSKVDLESKQGQYLTQLGFITSKAISGSFGDKKSLVSPKDTEEIYLNVVIKQILARIDDSLKLMLPTITKDQKALFFRELKKSTEGIQDGINVDFDRQVKAKQQKLIVDKQDSQH